MKIFRNFLPKGGGPGVLPIPKFPFQKKLGPPNCWKGAGGSQDFEVFLKKKTVFFIDASPYGGGRCFETRGILINLAFS